MQNAEALTDGDLENAQGGGLFSPRDELAKRGFNPQPEPPAKLVSDGFDPTGEIRAKGFNPQSEPPPQEMKTLMGY